MADRINRTRAADAPLSSARTPAATGTGLAVEDDEALVGRTVSINLPRTEVYEFWRDFRNFPLFMENVKAVTILDSNRSHWVLRAPLGSTVEWDSEIVQDERGSLIEWRSAPGASIAHSGRVEFRDSSNDRGTVVTVTIAWDPPGGALGKLFAKVFRREPKVQARHELRRFKQLMETGEIPTAKPAEVA